MSMSVPACYVFGIADDYAWHIGKIACAVAQCTTWALSAAPFDFFPIFSAGLKKSKEVKEIKACGQLGFIYKNQ
ncbi:hypothetical protein [Azohydromonas lata]|uniref:hypothetical protein n=1 Tax=Azohydromonas lata TaxID=45677 RepID=UPI0012F4CA00|nr:hypothetical protein [Azohydromonas lata]